MLQCWCIPCCPNVSGQGVLNKYSLLATYNKQLTPNQYHVSPIVISFRWLCFGAYQAPSSCCVSHPSNTKILESTHATPGSVTEIGMSGSWLHPPLSSSNEMTLDRGHELQPPSKYTFPARKMDPWLIKGAGNTSNCFQDFEDIINITPRLLSVTPHTTNPPGNSHTLCQGKLNGSSQKFTQFIFSSKCQQSRCVVSTPSCPEMRIIMASFLCCLHLMSYFSWFLAATLKHGQWQFCFSSWLDMEQFLMLFHLSIQAFNGASSEIDFRQHV